MVSKHIGIVAVSPEGSALCYRKIFRHASRLFPSDERPRVTLHNEPFADYVAAVLRDDWQRVGEMLLSSAKVLAHAGADFAVVPDNVMQHGIHLSAIPAGMDECAGLIETLDQAPVHLA